MKIITITSAMVAVAGSSRRHQENRLLAEEEPADSCFSGILFQPFDAEIEGLFPREILGFHCRYVLCHNWLNRLGPASILFF